jgi:hypothetical protein
MPIIFYNMAPVFQNINWKIDEIPYGIYNMNN